MLHELLALQKESGERDTRIETQITYMSQQSDALEKRLDKQEELLSKMSDVLNDQKHLSTVVDNIVNIVNANKRDITAINDKLRELESASATKLYKFTERIIWIIIPVFVTAICGIIITRMGLK